MTEQQLNSKIESIRKESASINEAMTIELMKKLMFPISQRLDFTIYVMECNRLMAEDSPKSALENALEERSDFLDWAQGYKEAVEAAVPETLSEVMEELKKAKYEIDRVCNPKDGWC